MNRERLLWLALLVVGGLWLLIRAGFTDPGMAKSYVEVIPMEFVQVDVPAELGGGPGQTKWIDVTSDVALDYDLSAIGEDRRVSWDKRVETAPRNYYEAVEADPGQTRVRLSLSRSIGLWVAAFFTLAIFSFLYRDNPFYRVAESIVVGVSAAYWMVVGWWDVIVPNLIGKLLPGMIKGWAMPGLQAEAEWLYIVPLTLGVMLVWRLAPKGGWIARWPMSFIIGVYCGLRLISFLHADFLSQIRNSIQPVWVVSEAGQFMLWDTLRAVVLVVGVLCCLVYFFFSIEHKGIVGKTAKVGIWVMMVTFGAAFGYTVMGRIALLAIRLEFLFDDWLWLIDPVGRRVADVALMLGGHWPFG